MLRIAAVGFCFHIIPPHEFLALGKCPCAFAGHGAGLAGNTPVNIENGCKLSFRIFPIIGITHVTVDLPIIYFTHFN
jgi:hypothetical protein